MRRSSRSNRRLGGGNSLRSRHGHGLRGWRGLLNGGMSCYYGRPGLMRRGRLDGSRLGDMPSRRFGRSRRSSDFMGHSLVNHRLCGGNSRRNGRAGDRLRHGGFRGRPGNDRCGRSDRLDRDGDGGRFRLGRGIAVRIALENVYGGSFVLLRGLRGRWLRLNGHRDGGRLLNLFQIRTNIGILDLTLGINYGRLHLMRLGGGFLYDFGAFSLHGERAREQQDRQKSYFFHLHTPKFEYVY